MSEPKGWYKPAPGRAWLYDQFGRLIRDVEGNPTPTYDPATYTSRLNPDGSVKPFAEWLAEWETKRAEVYAPEVAAIEYPLDQLRPVSMDSMDIADTLRFGGGITYHVPEPTPEAVARYAREVDEATRKRAERKADRQRYNNAIQYYNEATRTLIGRAFVAWIADQGLILTRIDEYGDMTTTPDDAEILTAWIGNRDIPREDDDTEDEA